ncbi:MAG: RsbRD N-terminal domain-containing protein [Candidatus Hatepunaea meridiana]|nr:RsbRD N-terminal domain-containing protein [Candidatus Hatepunaea meridiana]
MSLKNLLEQNQDVIIERWLDLILATYPSDGSFFLKKQKNQFANPVGYTISKEIEILYQTLFKDVDTETISTSLDSIIKIRSVQDFSPSKAIGFIFLLKKAINDELGNTVKEEGLYSELHEIESSIDTLILKAFDSYMKSKDLLFRIRADELNRRTKIILSRYSDTD